MTLLTILVITSVSSAIAVWYMQLRMFGRLFRFERDKVVLDTTFTHIDANTFSRDGSVPGEDLVLILGDCMALSCGVLHNTARLHHVVRMHSPAVSVWGMIGATTTDMIDRVDEWAQHADTVMLFIGPNNITHGRWYALWRDMPALIAAVASHTHARQILWVVGDPGIVPALPLPLRFLARVVRTIFDSRIRYVQSLFPQLHIVRAMHGGPDCQFSQHPETFFAPDMFHPSDAGYMYIAQELMQELRK